MAAAWLESAAQTMARKQDITMDEGDQGGVHEKVMTSFGGHPQSHHQHHGASPAPAENWEAFDPGKLGIGEDDDDDDGMMEIRNGETRGVNRPGRYEEEENDDDYHYDDDGGGMMDDYDDGGDMMDDGKFGF